MNLEDQIPKQARDAVQQYLRRSLRVSLSNSDGRRENQDALELYQDILLEFWEYRESAKDPKGYIVGIAKRRFADHFREVKINFTKLQERLRYYFRQVQGFSLWKETSGEQWCGYAGWANRHQARASSEKIAALKSNPDLLQLEPLSASDFTDLVREDWVIVVEGVLDYLEGPVPFKDFTRIVCGVLHVTEFVEESIDAGSEDDDGRPPIQPVSRSSSQQATLYAREMASQLWREICELLPKQRIAYVLNPTEADIEDFIVSGIVSYSELRQSLGLSSADYDLLWRELPIADDDRSMLPTLSDDDERFALLRRYLPIEDKIIARLLSATRNQVIGLRSCALRRLKRRMAAFRDGPKLRAVKKKE
jgi:DNA-directed RNA polymerase specialized sigma24 family protein